MQRSEFQEINQSLLNERMMLIDLEENVRIKEKEILSWEQSQMADICDQQDGNGKPLYSNAEKRQAELAIRQTNSSDWCQMDEKLSDLRMLVAQTKARIAFKSNDIQYGINHAADEINEQLARIAQTVDKAVSVAAFNAVKILMTDFACKSIDRAQQNEQEFREEQEAEQKN